MLLKFATWLCETLKIIERDKHTHTHTQIERECGLFTEKGHLGFHLLPQLKMLLKGLMGLVSLLLLQVHVLFLFFFSLNFDVIKNMGFVFYLIIVR